LRAAQSIRQDHRQVGVLVFSQYIEIPSAAELIAGAPAGASYLLKDRVADVSDFIDTITTVAQGGTGMRTQPRDPRGRHFCNRSRQSCHAGSPYHCPGWSFTAGGVLRGSRVTLPRVKAGGHIAPCVRPIPPIRRSLMPE
jgi:hypothetical protein